MIKDIVVILSMRKVIVQEPLPLRSLKGSIKDINKDLSTKIGKMSTK